LGWALQIALDKDAKAWETQWMVIELLEAGKVKRDDIFRALMPDTADAPSRAAARLASAEAWRLLAAVSTQGTPGDWRDVQASVPALQEEDLASRVEYLEVYTFKLAFRGESDSLSAMRAALQTRHKDLGRALDFSKLEDAKWAIRKLEGQFPPQLARLERRR
jgi:hypothetical protein